MKLDYLSLLSPIKRSLLIAAYLQTFSAIASVLPFICIVSIMGTLIAAPVDRNGLLIWLIIAVVALVVRTVCGFAAGCISHFADNDLQLLLRQKLTKRLQQVELGWFSDQSSGAIKKILQDDVSTMHHLVAHSILEFITALIVPLITIVYLCHANVLMTCSTLIPLIIGMLLYWLQIKRFSAHAAQYHSDLTQVNRSAVELLDGIEVTKVFSASENKQQRFNTIAQQFINDFWGWCKEVIKIAALSEVLLSPAVILLWNCMLSALFISQYHLSSVDAVAFILLGTNLAGSFYTLDASIPTLQASMSAAQRVYDILHLSIQSQPTNPQIPISHDIQYKNVDFAYADSSRPILNNINLSLKSGTMTAVVGPSGSGKSTLARLLLRNADPTRGAITLGNVDLRNIDNNTLFAQVGFVFQNIALLQATIAENIALGKPDATIDEIRAAAREAQIEDKILSLPNGYQTILKEGLKLSGGEAQRIAIARVILADKPILVLDEPTAFADASSERAIQQALSWISRHKTVLIISHNLCSIMNADNIVVLVDGEIVGQGTHQSLLKNCPDYITMWNISESALLQTNQKGDKDE